MGHVTTLLSGMVFIYRLGLATVNLSLKFRSSPVMTIWKAIAKCRNRDGLGYKGGHSRSFEIAYEFLLAFYTNNVPILHCFWDTARYWCKIAGLNLPHLYLVPPFGVTPFEFLRDLCLQKTRVAGLSCGKVLVIQCLAILV